jgi:uncharacterized lipoprotein YddW (UPF0748 family)
MIRLLTILTILLSTQNQAQAQVMMWWDAHANFQRLGQADSVRFYLDKCKSVGVTDIVVDVKPITGEVLFASQTAPFLQEWKGYTRSRSFDMLATTIEYGHALGLRIHAGMNVFCGGHQYFNRGIIYDGHSAWQTILYRDSGLVPITQIKSKYSGMLNPADPAVQAYQLQVIKELITLYPKLDGIILDRVRFDGIEADFSPLSRKQFEQYLGSSIQAFPADIFTYSKEKERIPGKHYQAWLSWRASVIYQFIQEARNLVKQINPSIKFGDYTGAWYPTYYEVGANWASQDYNPAQDYSWADKNYQRYGYASLLDIYTTGCYFYEVEKKEVLENNARTAARTEAGMSQAKAPWYSVEGSAELAMKVTKGVVPVWGGLYVEQYKDQPAQFRKAMEMCLRKTNGLMLFDLVHICEKKWWGEIASVTKKPRS